MPTERKLPLTVILKLKEMYEERDGRGIRRYSYETLALAMGVSGSTVLRVIRGLGPYANAAHLKPEERGADEMLRELAGASALRLMEKLKEGAPIEPRGRSEAERGEELRKLQHGEITGIGPTAAPKPGLADILDTGAAVAPTISSEPPDAYPE